MKVCPVTAHLSPPPVSSVSGCMKETRSILRRNELSNSKVKSWQCRFLISYKVIIDESHPARIALLTNHFLSDVNCKIIDLSLATFSSVPQLEPLATPYLPFGIQQESSSDWQLFISRLLTRRARKSSYMKPWGAIVLVRVCVHACVRVRWMSPPISSGVKGCPRLLDT